jgi:hypothetical protein
MDFRYMREEFERLCDKEGGIEVRVRASEGTAESARVFLRLPEDQPLPAAKVPGAELAPPPESATPAAIHNAAYGSAHSSSTRWFMLITLGAWVNEPDTWDESAWGGSPTATRSGYGYYPAMSDEDLLNACRLFWKFNPKSPTWQGIEYAVVAHDGEIRAVVHIDEYIGPFWGRWGFRGRIVADENLLRDLIGREVPRRQNPVTAIELRSTTSGMSGN